MAEIVKYNPMWMCKQNKDFDWYDKQAEYLQTAINDTKALVLKMIITDADVLEAYSPILFKYRFEYKLRGYKGFVMNELTIYIK